MRVDAEGMPPERLAGSVELEQLLGHVAHRAPHAGLGALPRRAAQPVQRGVLGAGILLNQIEVLDRHEQLVPAGVAELHELVRAVIDGDPLETDELPDAVVDMDDVIAHFEIT